MKTSIQIILGVVSAILIIGGIRLLSNNSSLETPPSSHISDENILGTAAGSNISYAPTLLPIATSSVSNYNDLGTSTRKWAHLFADYATTTSIDVYDELKIGRNATTTIVEGDITTTNLTVTGTCTGCGGATSADLQDAYNTSAVDAEILTANDKSIIFALQDTATDANFIIDNLGGKGELRMASASTTNAVFTGYGRLGIGTTTPGAGLSLTATTSILGFNGYLFGQLTLPNLVATSTDYSGFGTSTPGTSLGVQDEVNIGNLIVEGPAKAGILIATSSLENRGTATSSWANAGLLVAGGGLASSKGITLTGGDFLLSAGKITVIDTSTSTVPVLNASTLLQSAYIDLSGRLDSSYAGTSTFAGGVTTGLFSPTTLYVSNSATSTTEGGLLVRTGGLRILTGGLEIAGGDLLSVGLLKVSNTGTSTIAGTIDIQSTTGTSTIAGSLDIAKSLNIGGAVHLQMASTTNNGTTTVALDCSLAPRATVIFDKDGSGVVYKNCYGGDVHTSIITIPKTDLINGIRLNWLGIVDANGEYGTTSPVRPRLKFRIATTTIGYMSQGADNICVALFATTSDNMSTDGYVECGDTGYRDPY